MRLSAAARSSAISPVPPTEVQADQHGRGPARQQEPAPYAEPARPVRKMMAVTPREEPTAQLSVIVRRYCARRGAAAGSRPRWQGLIPIYRTGGDDSSGQTVYHSAPPHTQDTLNAYIVNDEPW